MSRIVCGIDVSGPTYVGQRPGSPHSESLLDVSNLTIAIMHCHPDVAEGPQDVPVQAVKMPPTTIHGDRTVKTIVAQWVDRLCGHANMTCVLHGDVNPC